jgi:hypothetical protein
LLQKDPTIVPVVNAQAINANLVLYALVIVVVVALLHHIALLVMQNLGTVPAITGRNQIDINEVFVLQVMIHIEASSRYPVAFGY